MKIYISNEITNNREVAFIKNFWTGKISLIIDGRPAVKINKNQYKLRLYNGFEYITVMGNKLYGIDLDFEKGSVRVVEKLTLLNIIMVLIPVIILIIIGGVLGGIIGGLASICILVLYRISNNNITNILLALVVYVFALWMFFAFSLLNIIK